MASIADGAVVVPKLKLIQNLPRAGTPSSSGRPSKNRDSAREWWWSNRTPRTNSARMPEGGIMPVGHAGMFKAESSYSRNFSLNSAFVNTGGQFWKSTDVDFPRVSHHKYGFEKRPDSSRPGTALGNYGASG